MKRKGFFSVLTIFTLAVSGVSCSAQIEAQKNAGQNANAARDSNAGATVKKVIDDTSSWKVFKDTKNNFSLRYPSNLKMQKKTGGVRFYHTIKFRHQDPCDNSDDAPELKELVDFDITFKVVNENFQTRQWAADDRDGEIKLGANGANGKIVSHTYDGCGHDEYVYPLKTGKSFVAEYQIIGLSSSIYADFPGAKEALQHPDLLKNRRGNRESDFEEFRSTEKINASAKRENYYGGN